MSGGIELTNPERRMLRAMLDAPDAIHSLSHVMNACNWSDQAVAVGAGQGLSDKGLAETQESVRRTIHPGKEGHSAIANGLLEARLWAWISSQDKPTMAKLQAKFERHEAGTWCWFAQETRRTTRCWNLRLRRFIVTQI